jgi:hypothetical protein
MTQHLPHPANVPGDFYVEDGCCTMCEVPFSEAHDLFGISRYPIHCFVKRQPETPAEVDQMVRAIQFAELKCIRYRGTDRLLQLRLVETGEGETCDNLPVELRRRSEEVLEEQRRQRAAEGLWAWLRRLWRSSS